MSIVSVSRAAGPPHFGALGVDPVLGGRERALALGGVVLDVGELDRELVLGDGTIPPSRSAIKGIGAPQ